MCLLYPNWRLLYGQVWSASHWFCPLIQSITLLGNLRSVRVPPKYLTTSYFSLTDFKLVRSLFSPVPKAIPWCHQKVNFSLSTCLFKSSWTQLLVFLLLLSSLTYFTTFSHTYCIFIINSSNFCYKGIKQLFLLNSHFPTRLEIFDSSTPPPAFVNTSLYAAVQAPFVTYSLVIGIYLFFDGLVYYKPVDLARFSGINSKSLAGKTAWHRNTENAQWCIIYF